MIPIHLRLLVYQSAQTRDNNCISYSFMCFSTGNKGADGPTEPGPLAAVQHATPALAGAGDTAPSDALLAHFPWIRGTCDCSRINSYTGVYATLYSGILWTTEWLVNGILGERMNWHNVLYVCLGDIYKFTFSFINYMRTEQRLFQ